MRQVCVSSCIEETSQGPRGLLCGQTSWKAASLLGRAPLKTALQAQGDANVTTHQGNCQQWDSSESVFAFLPRWGVGIRASLPAPSPLSSPWGEGWWRQESQEGAVTQQLLISIH